MANLKFNNIGAHLMEYLERFGKLNNSKCIFVARNEWRIAPLVQRAARWVQRETGAHLVEVDLLRAARENKSPRIALLEALRKAVGDHGIALDAGRNVVSNANALCDALFVRGKRGMIQSPVLLIKHVQCFCEMMERGQMEEYIFFRDIHARVMFSSNMAMLPIEAAIMPVGAASVLAPLTMNINMDEDIPYRTNEWETACAQVMPTLWGVPAGMLAHNGGPLLMKELNCYFRSDGYARCMYAFADADDARESARKFAEASQSKTGAPLIRVDMAKAAAGGHTLADAVVEAFECYAKQAGLAINVGDDVDSMLADLCLEMTGESIDNLASQPIVLITDVQCCARTHRMDKPEDFAFIARLPARVVLSGNMLPDELEKALLPPEAEPVLGGYTDVVTKVGEELYCACDVDKACDVC